MGFPLKFKLAALNERLANWSKQVKMRDGYVCSCGELQNVLLDAHHIEPKAQCPEKMFEMDNGKTICLWGHAMAHQDNPRIRDMILARLAVAIFPHLYPDTVKAHGMIKL